MNITPIIALIATIPTDVLFEILLKNLFSIAPEWFEIPAHFLLFFVIFLGYMHTLRDYIDAVDSI